MGFIIRNLEKLQFSSRIVQFLFTGHFSSRRYPSSLNRIHFFSFRKLFSDGIERKRRKKLDKVNCEKKHESIGKVSFLVTRTAAGELVIAEIRVWEYTGRLPKSWQEDFFLSHVGRVFRTSGHKGIRVIRVLCLIIFNPGALMTELALRALFTDFFPPFFSFSILLQSSLLILVFRHSRV